MALPSFNVGQKLAAADLQALSDYMALSTDSTIGTAASGFTDAGSNALFSLGGTLVTVVLILTNTNAITATNGNFSDVPCFTLDAAYRPNGTINAIVGNGSTTGEATINAAGGVTIRAASDTIGAGSTLRITAAFQT